MLDELRANFVRKPGVRFIDRDGKISTTWCFNHVIQNETYLSFQVIRGEFDHILLKNAAKNGADVREETSVIEADVTSESDRVTVTSLDSAGKKECPYSAISSRCERPRRLYRREERLA